MTRSLWTMTVPMILAAVLSSAQATADETTAPKGETALFEATEKNLAVVHFSPGETDLTQTDQNALLDTVNSAKKAGKVDEIIIAAWSDKEYPATKDQKLTRADEKLADKRADTVKRFLKDKK